MTEPPLPPTTPRIEPVGRETATDEQAAMLDKLGPAAALNLFRTLVHHPDLMRSWLRFGGQLLQKSTLPGADREVVILRTAARCASDYEWGQHVGIGRLEGVDDETILRCGAIAASPTTGDLVGLLLVATDELVIEHCLTDATWTLLAEHYDTSQLLELTMLVGHYAMVAGMLRSAGVQTEVALPRVGKL